MDFVTGFLLSFDWKGDSYNSILNIVNWLTKMVNDKPVKVTIDAPRLAKVILNVVVWHYSLPESIINDWEIIFMSQFWSLLCYFLGIKQWLSTTSHF